MDALNRELAARKSHAEWEERHRIKIEDDLKHWDDDEKAERGKELFFTDRQVSPRISPSSIPLILADATGDVNANKSVDTNTKPTCVIGMKRTKSARS